MTSGASQPGPAYQVLSPVPAQHVTGRQAAPALGTVAGKRFAFAWDHLFQCEVGTGTLRNPDAAEMQAFRSADLPVGGGHLYASVTKYLQTDIAPRLFGSSEGADNRTVFTAVAALTEMAGWVARDAGRDAIAKQHFGRSLALVQSAVTTCGD